MEKFGIFELLDALAAITETAPSPAEEEATEAQSTDEPAAVETATRRVPDAAFSAPSYGQTVPTPPPAGPNALEGFLARHDAVRRKVKK